MPKEPKKQEYPPGMTLRHTLRGHEGTIFGIAWSPDGRTLASGSLDNTTRLWDAESGKLLRTHGRHFFPALSISWSPDGRTLASGSDDKTIRLWDAESGKLLRTLEGHSGSVYSIPWSPDGQTLASGSSDQTICLWDAESGKLRQTLQGHSGEVWSLSWSPDGRMLASSSLDNTIRLWNRESGKLHRTLEDHFSISISVSWSPDGRTLASGSNNKTIHLWDPQTGRLLNVLEGHTKYIKAISFSSDGRLLASKSDDGTARLWRCDTWETIAVLDELQSEFWPPKLAFHPSKPVLATLGEKDTVIRIWDLDYSVLLGAEPTTPSVHYKNAKVVLVGDSGVGKSGLGLVLTGKKFEPTESTHGRHVWTFDNQEVELDGEKRKETRETLLWDLAGQPGYRLFHQLHLSEVAVALVLFDARSETDPFAGVGYWARALDEATRGFPLIKFLVAARSDRGGPRVSQERINAVLERYGFSGFFETSAKNKEGVKELEQAIKTHLPWNDLPSISAPELFAKIKDFLINEKEEGRVLSTPEELLLNFKNNDKKSKEISKEIFNTCLGGIEAAGLAMQLSFSKQVLLQPEMIDNYCAWMAHEARRQPDQLGYIPEERAKSGNFTMDEECRIKNKNDEEMMLINSVKEVVGRGIAIRQPTDKGEMLVFPSELRKDLTDYPGGYSLEVAFRFKGPISAIYATLAVRLINSVAFEKDELFMNAALFRCTENQLCGFAVEYPDKTNNTLGRLVVFFDKNTVKNTKLLFLRYVNQQLEKLALEGSVERERIYQCPSCGYTIPPDAVVLRKERKEKTVICPVCMQKLPIDDLAEESALSDELVDAIEANAIEEQERQERLTVLDKRVHEGEFHVFLCHNSKDKAVVKEIGEQLKERGILPWLDEWELRPGLSWLEAIEKQLARIKSAAVFVGKNGISGFQEEELNAFIAISTGNNYPVIPVILADASEEPELPTLLKNKHWVDLRKKDPDPLKQLIWGITGEKDI